MKVKHSEQLIKVYTAQLLSKNLRSLLVYLHLTVITDCMCLKQILIAHFLLTGSVPHMEEAVRLLDAHGVLRTLTQKYKGYQKTFRQQLEEEQDFLLDQNAAADVVNVDTLFQLLIPERQDWGPDALPHFCGRLAVNIRKYLWLA